ncbi:TetR/AcrR family transcriptional regulator [Thermoflavimicrobium dichotomicum]|uniref:DNA-binding transcriptional regulator, AcrR family n=1 Tax=Thermoflavimicrobium dichotomicum TaxID=46223 RepID=A0A1I3LA49_9BACL|nr:TetR/AcrR family transcriptional regulator [Thermoflavimicrobium dichotomicum]SFI81430.1 DNA-binding transcriptional regulator, AcrR family [Thermoflavimicrobium dichotomicum]
MKFQREKVIQVARSLFVEEGYQYVTMRKIAHVLGYSHGTLYYHFKDKASLIHEILQQDFAHMREKMTQATQKQGEPISQLRTVIYTFIRFGIDHPHHYRLMFVEKDPDFAIFQLKEADVTFQILLDMVHQAAAELQDLPPNQIAWMIFMAAHGFISQNIADQTPWEALSSLAKHYIDMVIQGLKKQ